MNSLARLPSNTLSLKSEWIGKTNKKLPHYRSNAAGGRTKDGKFILIGGMNKYQEPKRNVWLYHGGDWDTETLPQMNIARESHGCVILDNKVYVLGGRNRHGCLIKSVEMLDLRQLRNGWTFVAPMKIARAPLAVAAVPGSNTLHVFGCSGEMENRSVERLDLSTNLWKRMPSMPHSSHMLATYGSTVVGGEIFIIGQNAKSKQGGAAIVFDPLSSSWIHSKELNLKLERSGSPLMSGSVTFVQEEDGDIYRDEKISIRSMKDNSAKSANSAKSSNSANSLRKTKKKRRKVSAAGQAKGTGKVLRAGRSVGETVLTALSFL